MNKRSNNSPEEPKDLTWGEIFSRWGGVLRKRKVLVESRAAQGYPEVDSESIRSATGEIRRLTRLLALSAGTIAITVAGLVGPMIYFSVRGEQPGAIAPAARADATPRSPGTGPVTEEEINQFAEKLDYPETKMRQLREAVHLGTKIVRTFNIKMLQTYLEAGELANEIFNRDTVPDRGQKLKDFYKIHGQPRFYTEGGKTLQGRNYSTIDGGYVKGEMSFQDELDFGVDDLMTPEGPNESWFSVHNIPYYDEEARMLRVGHDPKEREGKRLQESILLMAIAVNDAYTDRTEGQPDYTSAKVDEMSNTSGSKEKNLGMAEAMLQNMDPLMSETSIVNVIFNAIDRSTANEVSALNMEYQIYLSVRKILASGLVQSPELRAKLINIAKRPVIIRNDYNFTELSPKEVGPGELFARSGWRKEEASRIGEILERKNELNEKTVEAVFVIAGRLELTGSRKRHLFEDLIQLIRQKGIVVLNSGFKGVEPVDSEGLKYLGRKDGKFKIQRIIGSPDLPSVDWAIKRRVSYYHPGRDTMFIVDQQPDSPVMRIGMDLVALEDAQEALETPDQPLTYTKGNLMARFAALPQDHTSVARAFIKSAPMTTNFTSPEKIFQSIVSLMGTGEYEDKVWMKDILKKGKALDVFVYITLRILMQSKDPAMEIYKPSIKELIDHPERIDLVAIGRTFIKEHEANLK